MAAFSCSIKDKDISSDSESSEDNSGSSAVDSTGRDDRYEFVEATSTLRSLPHASGAWASRRSACWSGQRLRPLTSHGRESTHSPLLSTGLMHSSPKLYIEDGEDEHTGEPKRGSMSSQSVNGTAAGGVVRDVG
jgi:hypothetical protein